MDKLIIIDGNSLAYRNYHAAKNSENGLIYSADGIPITVSKAFIGSIKKLIREQSPTHLIVCFDPDGKNWRHELYPDYKGNRTKDENYEDFLIDLRNLRAILEEIKITVEVISGYEADDCIASLAHELRNEYLEIIIYSTDKDLLQLVDDDFNTRVLRSHSGATKLYTEKTCFQDLGVVASKVADFKALMGDASDNIPGVKGIGKISAATLLEKYSNVQAIADSFEDESIENLPKTLAKKIEPETGKMLMFKRLTELKTDLETGIHIEQLRVDKIEFESEVARELDILI